MSDVPTSAKPIAGQADVVVPGSKDSGRLLRRTFVIALVLVSGGLLTSGVVELFFRYRESVEAIEELQREMAQGQPSRFSSSCGTSRRPCERRRRRKRSSPLA